MLLKKCDVRHRRHFNHDEATTTSNTTKAPGLDLSGRRPFGSILFLSASQCSCETLPGHGHGRDGCRSRRRRTFAEDCRGCRCACSSIDNPKEQENEAKYDQVFLDGPHATSVGVSTAAWSHVDSQTTRRRSRRVVVEAASACQTVSFEQRRK